MSSSKPDNKKVKPFRWFKGKRLMLHAAKYPVFTRSQMLSQLRFLADNHYIAEPFPIGGGMYIVYKSAQPKPPKEVVKERRKRDKRTPQYYEILKASGVKICTL